MSRIAAVYIETFRNIPLLLQVFLVLLRAAQFAGPEAEPVTGGYVLLECARSLYSVMR